MQRQVQELLDQGYDIVQVDECIFSPNRLDDRTWAPKRHPFVKDSKWSPQGYVAVVGAVSAKQGWILPRLVCNRGICQDDMVEFLDWALPNAETAEESIVVLLDWFSGHRTEEVEELIARKGHILLFMGEVPRLSRKSTRRICTHFSKDSLKR